MAFYREFGGFPDIPWRQYHRSRSPTPSKGIRELGPAERNERAVVVAVTEGTTRTPDRHGIHITNHSEGALKAAARSGLLVGEGFFHANIF